MILYNKVDLLFNKPLQISKGVFFRIPTVEQMCYEEEFAVHSYSLIRSTREIFSPYKEVDELEETFPNVWQMVFDEEGDQLFGSMNGCESGKQMVIDSISYWTSLPAEDFKPLSNKKIINQKADWIIDENVFDGICNLIKDVINYQQNDDLIAPKNMSERTRGIWDKLYKGRLANAKKNSNRTMADKILILQISMASYISIDEIKKMSIYHFNKLYEAIGEKESYEAQWQLKLSPKFDVKEGLKKHWKEKIKM